MLKNLPAFNLVHFELEKTKRNDCFQKTILRIDQFMPN